MEEESTARGVAWRDELGKGGEGTGRECKCVQWNSARVVEYDLV